MREQGLIKIIKNREFKFKLKSRPGMSLIITLLIASLGVMIALNMLFIFNLSVEAKGYKQNKFNAKIILNSLIHEAYGWLANEIDAGRGEYNISKLNLNLDDLKIFNKDYKDCYVNIYVMSYDLTLIVSADKAKNFNWLNFKGAEKFVPYKSGAFLIRAVSDKMMIEAVIDNNKKLWSIEEIWI